MIVIRPPQLCREVTSFQIFASLNIATPEVAMNSVSNIFVSMYRQKMLLLLFQIAHI